MSKQSREYHRAYMRTWRAESPCIQDARRIKRNLTGRQFGKLTVVIRLTSPDKKHTPWLCECECGNITTANADALHAGMIKSCGECVLHGHREPGIAARNQVWYQYKSSAAKRHMEWALTDADFDRLTKLSCHYCGVAPSKVYVGSNGDFIYSGIDRVDNRQGYVTANVVPCCQTCNLAKRNMSVTDFLRWAIRVAKFNEVK